LETTELTRMHVILSSIHSPALFLDSLSPSLSLSRQTWSSPLERYAHINYNAALKVSHAICTLLETDRSLPNPLRHWSYQSEEECENVPWNGSKEGKFSLVRENRAQGESGDFGKYFEDTWERKLGLTSVVTYCVFRLLYSREVCDFGCRKEMSLQEGGKIKFN